VPVPGPLSGDGVAVATGALPIEDGYVFFTHSGYTSALTLYQYSLPDGVFTRQLGQQWQVACFIGPGSVVKHPTLPVVYVDCARWVLPEDFRARVRAYRIAANRSLEHMGDIDPTEGVTDLEKVAYDYGGTFVVSPNGKHAFRLNLFLNEDAEAESGYVVGPGISLVVFNVGDDGTLMIKEVLTIDGVAAWNEHISLTLAHGGKVLLLQDVFTAAVLSFTVAEDGTLTEAARLEDAVPLARNILVSQHHHHGQEVRPDSEAQGSEDVSRTVCVMSSTN